MDEEHKYELKAINADETPSMKISPSLLIEKKKIKASSVFKSELE